MKLPALLQTIAVMTSGLAGVALSTAEPNAGTTHEEQTSRVMFDSRVSSDALFTAADRYNVDVLQVFHQNDGFTGIHAPDQSLPSARQSDVYKKQVNRAFGTEPEVTSAIIQSGSVSLSEFTDHLDDSSGFKANDAGKNQLRTWNDAKAKQQEREVTKRSQNSTTFASDTSSVVADSASGFLVKHVWEGATSLSTIPEDWGYESNWYLWNRDLRDQDRPSCGTVLPGPYSEFWLNRADSFTITVAINGANPDPELYGLYADDDDLFDSCQTAAFGLGVGFPQQIEEGPVEITVLFTAEPGQESSSEMSSSQKVTSNDCNDIGSDPISACMNLNGGREYPNGPKRLQGFPEQFLDLPNQFCSTVTAEGEVIFEPTFACYF